MILLLHELKENRKSLLIWSLTIGLICYGSILLYDSVAGQLSQVADL
ncbi:ABC transporter permease, partial [Streptococcus pyogenes]